MIHISRKLLKHKISCFSFVPYFPFSAQQPSPAAEKESSEIEEDLKLPVIKPRKKKKMKIIDPQNLPKWVTKVETDMRNLDPQSLKKKLVYSFPEGESDTEICDSPVFSLDQGDELPEEEVINVSRTIKPGRYQFTFKNPEAKKDQAMLALFKYIYENYKPYFIKRMMKMRFDQQKKMFPHSIEEQTFEIPLEKTAQREFLKEILTRLETERVKHFSLPKGKEEYQNPKRNWEAKRRISFHIYRMTKDPKETGRHITKIVSIVNEALLEKNYELISAKDFRGLLVNEEFSPQMQAFLNPEFFKANPYLIGNYDVDELFKAYLKSPKLLKNLEFVRYHRRFLSDGLHQQHRTKTELYNVLASLKNVNDIDYISFIYHVSRIYLIDQTFFPRIDLNVWNQALTRLYWGKVDSFQEKETFQNYLHHLLFESLKIEQNSKLSAYFVELALTSKTCSLAQTAITISLMILARIVEGASSLKDLFDFFISTISEESFNFYIKESLLAILNESGQKTYFERLQRALEEDGEAKAILATFFDQHFYGSSKSQDHTIQLSYNFPFENFNKKLILDPCSKNLLAQVRNQDSEQILNEVRKNSEHKPAIKFMLERDYQVLVSSIRDSFLEVFDKGRTTRRLWEDPKSYNTFFDKFDQMIQRLTFDNSLDFQNEKKILKLVNDLAKPYRESLNNLEVKTAFDRRLERFVWHANDELRKFAEARENWAYSILKPSKMRKQTIKRGYYVIRGKNGRLAVVRVSYKGRVLPTNIPVSYLKKHRYPNIRKQIEKRKKITLLRKITKGQRKRVSKRQKIKRRQKLLVRKWARRKSKLAEKAKKPKKLQKIEEKVEKKIEELNPNQGTPIEKEMKETQREENSPKQIEPQKIKGLENKTKGSFSTLKPSHDLDEDYDNEVQKNDMESGFKVYLQKLKEIEERKKKEEDAQKRELGQLSTQELEKMKKSLFQEDPLYRSAFSKSQPTSRGVQKEFKLERKQTKREEGKLFERINFEQKRTPRKGGLFQGMKIKSEREVDEFEEIENDEKKEFGQSLPKKTELEIPYIGFWREKFSEKEFELKEIVGIVKRSLADNEKIRKDLLLALSHIEEFGSAEISGSNIIENLMREKAIQLEPLDKLSVDFISQAGVSSKDYNNYLKATYLNFELAQDVYINLFKYYQGSVDYNRKSFKRAMTHLIRYNTQISDEVINEFIGVIKKQKLGMTFLEFIHLIIKNQIQINKTAATALLAHLKDYKVLSDDIVELFKLFLKTYNWDYELSLISPYVDLLIFQKKQENYMGLFEKIKDFLIARKFTKGADLESQIKHNVASNQEVQVKTDVPETERQEITPKKKESVEVHTFYMDFIEKLNDHKIYKFSKLIFYDFVNNQFEFTLRDYLVGLKTFKDSGEEFNVLYKKFKATPFFIFDQTVFALCLEAINFNPEILAPLFDEINEEYVITKKYELSIPNLNSFITAFGRTQKFFEFTNFLRFLGQNNNGLNRSVKLNCYKVLGKVTDDMSKPYIKGLIDALFDENQFEKEDKQRLENMRKKQEARKQKKEAKKQKDVETSTQESSITQEKTAKNQLSEPEKTEKFTQEKSKEKEPKSAVEIANKDEKSQTKGKKEKDQIKQIDSKKDGAPEKAQLGLGSDQSSTKKQFLKNPLDRMERSKGKQRRLKKILQSKDTWERINDSINFEEEEN